MGEAGPGVWAEEFARSGRVVFPQRRVRVWVRLGLTVAVAVYVASPSEILDGDRPSAYAMICLAMFAVVAAYCLWQLVTRQPMLTVDRVGIRYGGRKPRLPWEDVATIGFVIGTKGMRRLQVVPENVWANSFDVQQDNVKDLVAFAGWLTEVLEQRRSEVRE